MCRTMRVDVAVVLGAFLCVLTGVVFEGCGAAPPPAAPKAAEGFAIDGVHVEFSADKAWFDISDDPQMTIRLWNTSASVRYIGVLAPHPAQPASATTKVEIDGTTVEVLGLPCDVFFFAERRWSSRLNEQGFSLRHGKPLELKPGARSSFHVHHPLISTSPARQTGLWTAASRFAVSKSPKGPYSVVDGPEATLTIVDKRKLDDAVALLQRATESVPPSDETVLRVLSTIDENSLPEHVPLVLQTMQRKLKVGDFGRQRCWEVASRFVHADVYRAAVAQAVRGDLTAELAPIVLRAIYRNRGFLRREDALAILDNPRFADARFLGKQEGVGFYPTEFLALVAQEPDIPRLARLCAHKLPPRLELDASQATSVDRRLANLRDAFLRYPNASREPLREVVALGLKPGEFAPWAHEFRIGNVPRSLVLFAEWLAEMKDVASIPLLERFAETELVRVSDTMRQRVPELLARIDGPEAMHALRRLGGRGLRERAGLGDPAAIDALLEQSRRLLRSRQDDTLSGARLVDFVASLLEPEKAGSIKGVADRDAVERLWQARRASFVQAFKKKYGFDFDAPEPQPEPAGAKQ